MAQKISLEQASRYMEAFSSQVNIPAAYRFHSVTKVQADHTPALLFRYQKTKTAELNEEHFSFLVSENDTQILGFMCMDKKYADTQMLPENEAEKIADPFLSNLDKGLAGELKKLWIKRHDENVVVDGKPVTIAGLKYKCYRASHNDYAWVIIGFDGTIIAFERNVKWDNDKQQRITEKWLHDSWLAANKIAGQTSDEERLKETIQKSFLNGILNELNTQDIDKGFHPEFAILIAAGAQLKRLTLPVWKTVVSNYKNSAELMKSGYRNVDYSFELVDITGKAAIVKIQLSRKGQLITTDYLSFLKFDDGWKAVSKVSNEHIPNPFNL